MIQANQRTKARARKFIVHHRRRLAYGTMSTLHDYRVFPRSIYNDQNESFEQRPNDDSPPIPGNRTTGSSSNPIAGLPPARPDIEAISDEGEKPNTLNANLDYISEGTRVAQPSIRYIPVTG